MVFVEPKNQFILLSTPSPGRCRFSLFNSWRRAATRSYLSANRRVGSTHHHHWLHRRGTFISADARPLMCIPCKYYPRPVRHREYIRIHTPPHIHWQWQRRYRNWSAEIDLPSFAVGVYTYYTSINRTEGWAYCPAETINLLIHWLPKKKGKI